MMWVAIELSPYFDRLYSTRERLKVNLVQVLWSTCFTLLMTVLPRPGDCVIIELSLLVLWLIK